MRKYLFLCNLNLERSKFIEKYLRQLLKDKKKEGEIRTGGADPLCVNYIDQINLDWADVIFVLNEKPENLIKDKFSFDKNKIVNLDILDIYSYETGKFSHSALDNTLDYLTSMGEEKEAERISQKEEILDRLNLKDVLKKRNLEQYLD